MAGFPGDPPVRIAATHALARGDPYNLSALSMGSHTGTHVDPPSHFLPGGVAADQLDLSVLNGPCEVVQIADAESEVGPSAVRHLPEGIHRVLFRTANSARWSLGGGFFSDYVALSAGAGEAAVARGLRLVGIDALSIERDDTGRFPVHHRLLGSSVLILEGLRLDGVPPGRYHLECLPLRIVGGDGAPARAVLTPA